MLANEVRTARARSERRRVEAVAPAPILPIGRPRDPSIDAAILEAARLILAEEGYGGLTFDLVARRAGVSRPTIYLRWPSKPHLVHQAIFSDTSAASLPATGDFEADLLALVRGGLDAYARPAVRAALPGLIADLHGHPDLRASVIESMEQQVRRHLAALVQSGIGRGEIRADLDHESLFDLVYGALMHRVVVRGIVDPKFVDSILELVMRSARADHASGSRQTRRKKVRTSGKGSN